MKPSTPEVGRSYTFGWALCSLFHRIGWSVSDISPTTAVRCVALYELQDHVGREAEFCDDAAKRTWYVHTDWWHDVSAVRLTLAEKERARMATEPWVSRRDRNLRDMFKPK